MKIMLTKQQAITFPDYRAGVRVAAAVRRRHHQIMDLVVHNHNPPHLRVVQAMPMYILPQAMHQRDMVPLAILHINQMFN